MNSKDWAHLPDYITADEAAEISGYHVNYIRRIMRQGKVKGRKTALVWLIERDSLQAYLAKVQEQLAQLSDGLRTVLYLVAVEGRSYQETADMLDIPTGTVMSRLARARQQLILATGGAGALL